MLKACVSKTNFPPQTTTTTTITTAAAATTTTTTFGSIQDLAFGTRAARALLATSPPPPPSLCSSCGDMGATGQLGVVFSSPPPQWGIGSKQ